MDSTVVFRAARGLTDAGLAVLRFNFRGVGGSAGSQGEGDEEGDLEAALCYLGQQWPSTPLWAGGFSFGARVAIKLAADQKIPERVLLWPCPSWRLIASLWPRSLSRA